MPVKNLRAENGLGIITECSGILRGDEFIDAIRERYTPADILQKIRYYITDHTDVEHFEMSTDDIVKLTEITVAASKINPNICLASVVPSDLGFGLVRMWHGYAYDLAWPSRMCRSRDEAIKWIREKCGLHFEQA